MTPSPSFPSRAIELDIVITATPAEIWQALASADGLRQWFPPIAEGGDALGAELLLSWGSGIDWRTRVSVWDENHRLQWTEASASDTASTTAPATIDWRIEIITGGRCVLRLVHSGLRAEADLDAQYNANKEGWTYFLFNLRHYLEHHPAGTRIAINERRLVTIPRPKLWTQLLGDHGLRATHSGTKGVRVGDRLAFTMDSGRSIPFVVGRVEPSMLWGTLASLHDGLLMIELEPGASEYHFGIYLSVYDLPRRDVDALSSWCRTVADRSLAIEAAR